jgi:hypothetical protein
VNGDAGGSDVRSSLIASFAAIVVALIALSGQLASRPPARPPDACVVTLDRVLEFADDHPDAARLYADESTELPPLASEDEIERCGDPEDLLEELAPRRTGRP